MKREKAEHIAEKVVAILEAERIKKKITKSLISKETGLSRTAWTLMVAKKNSPTLRTLLMVSDVIGIDLKEVIKQAEK